MAAGLGLVGVILVVMASPGTSLPEDPGLAPRRQRMPVAPMIPDYPAVLRAPIFAPDRAPGEAAGDGAAGTAQGLQLLGLAASPRAASAIVRGPDGNTHVLQPGETLQGWRLIAVTPDRAMFDSPAGRVGLTLGGPAPSTSGPASPAGQANASETP